MRKLSLCVLILLLSCGTCFAKFTVSPVIVEGENVQAGNSFIVTCQNWGSEELEIEFSLALFDQGAEGSVFFLEDELSIQRAQEALSLSHENLTLEQYSQKLIEVTLERDDFDHLYVALFVKPKLSGVPTRLAVLFLLSTLGNQAELDISSWERREDNLSLTVQNSGRSHGLWQGELLCFDAAGELAKKVAVQSGIILAGRSRGVEVNLPSWVQSVELFQDQLGEVK